MKKAIAIIVLGLLAYSNSFAISDKQDLLLICHDVEKDLSHVIWEYKISYKENKIYAKSSDWADSSYPIIF